MLDFDLETTGLDDRVLSLAEAVNDADFGVPLRYMLVQPMLTVDRSLTRRVELDDCRGLRLTLPLQEHLAEFVRQLQWALGESSRVVLTLLKPCGPSASR